MACIYVQYGSMCVLAPALPVTTHMCMWLRELFVTV